MAQSSSGPPDTIGSPSKIAPSRTSSLSQPASVSSAHVQLRASSALTRTSSCVEYDRLVGKIMRDNFWSLDPFTVSLNPRLFDFHKEYIRSKAPHIKAKSRLLRRVLARMAEDEHLYLACASPVMYIAHPNRSTVDYLVMGDDPPWIPHFFNGSQAYPHIEEAMSRITHFLDSGRRFQPPTRLPTVGVSRASGYAISRLKTEELPSVEEYIDFVHFVVQSGSSPGSSGIIREDHFFPSLAVLPVAEVRRRANLITRLMSRMVEDDVLTRVSAEDGTYVLHRDCRPSDYMADRGLTDTSHWVWTFKKWAVLDTVAEMAVQNLDKFLMDISPAEQARVKTQPEDELPRSKLEPVSRNKQDDVDVYIVQQEQTASSNTRSRTPKESGPKHKRNVRNVSFSSGSESSGSDQSSVVPILTRPKSPSHVETSSSPEPELDPEDSLMVSIEDPDENSLIDIKRRERRTYADYFDVTSEDRRRDFPATVHIEFDALHDKYPNDSFEIVIEESMGFQIFEIICHDCNNEKIAMKYDGSLPKLELHLDAVQHITNVESKLKRTGEPRIDTVQTQKRMKAFREVSRQREGKHSKPISPSNLRSHSQADNPPINRNLRGSPSAQEVKNLRALYGLPQKAFNSNPPEDEVAMVNSNGIFDHKPSTPIMPNPSRLRPPSPLHVQNSLERLRNESAEIFDTVASSNKRRKLNLDSKLEHYGTLLGQAHAKYEELEESVATLGSRHDQHEAEFKNLAERLIIGLGPLLEAKTQIQQIPNEVTEQLEGLLTRDEQHEARWEEQEETRIKISAAIDDLDQGQKTLEGRISHMETRPYPVTATNESAIHARIKDLEISMAQLLESQKALEQDNRIANARFVLLEQHDESLGEAASLLTGIAARVENLEMIRSKSLDMESKFRESQKTITDRIEALEQQISMADKSTSMVTSGPISEMIALLKERCTAHDEHINRLGKALKKANTWIDYYEKLSTAQKAHIILLDNKQADEIVARATLEERMEERLKGSRVREENMADRIEELMKDNKEIEDRMLARIKKLEQREEHTSGQLALLKTYAPRSVTRSENERAGPSTPRGSSHTEAILPPFRASSQAVAGSSTPRPSTQIGGIATRTPHTGPIRPPSIVPSRIGTSTPRPSTQMSGSAPRSSQISPILPPTRPSFRSTSMGSSQTTTGNASPRPLSSQPSGHFSKSSEQGDTPKSSPMKYRKPRKF